jgi:hypothetical protein
VKPDRSGRAGEDRAPTRRAFVGIIGAAAAALVVKTPLRLPPEIAAREEDRPRSTWTGATRWIGHC